MSGIWRVARRIEDEKPAISRSIVALQARTASMLLRDGTGL
jgi:hypothetical protein